MKVAITGASGFIGQHLLETWPSKHELVCIGRHRPEQCVAENFYKVTDELTCPQEAFSSVDCVIHLAGLAAANTSRDSDVLANYQRVNCDYAVSMARQAAEAGVKQFIFLSSIKVNGEITEMGASFSEHSIPNPVGAYAQSKYQAEQRLEKTLAPSHTSLHIVRSPMVFGPGAASNIALLAKVIKLRFPLPFGCVKQNRRSLVSVYNLESFLSALMKISPPDKQVFFPKDANDVSTVELCQAIGAALGRKPLLLPIPESMMRVAFTLMRMKNLQNSLLESVSIDATQSNQTLNWSPPYTTLEALQKMRLMP